ncbi:hypothetical protein [Spiroplasma endosymbiont of Nebria brevicollis]|uniref:hypothetical protein n=1 Tax=Spiroplasma endosymbiont of Nebria brevicollis TaxID=3066284 RepID=UPI00313C2277
MLEKNKIELSNKLTKADNTDKINTSLKDTALSIVSDEKNIISVLINAGSMFADYILKPKKGTPSKEECSLQVNCNNFNYNILNCRNHLSSPFLISIIRNNENGIMGNYINAESALTKPNINFNRWWKL